MKLKTKNRPLVIGITLLFVMGLFLMSLGFSVPLAVSAGTVRAPSVLRAEFGMGANLITNGNFVESAVRYDTERGTPTLAHPNNLEVPAASVGTFAHIEDLDYYNPVESMGDIDTALAINFGTGRHPHDGLEMALKTHEIADHMLTANNVYYFTAWVKAIDATIYFDVFIGGGPNMFDLGRRFRVTPECGWTRIGAGPNGNFLPFRTNGEGGWHGWTTASQNIEDYRDNENAGNVNMYNHTNAYAWSNLIIAHFSTATGVSQSPAAGGYLITGLHLWQQQADVDTTVLGPLVNEYHTFDLRRFPQSAREAYLEAINVGRALLRTPNPSQADIDAAIEDIEDAREDLVQAELFADDLAALIEDAEARVRADYNNSWNAFYIVKNDAIELWEELDLDEVQQYCTDEQELIDEKYALLRQAINGLVNIVELRYAVEALEYILENKTAADFRRGWTVDWYNTANVRLADGQNRITLGTGAQVTAALNDINSSLNALVPHFDDSELVALLAEIRDMELTQSDFTQSTWNALQSAINDANTWLNQATSRDFGVGIQGVITRLETAVGALEYYVPTIEPECECDECKCEDCADCGDCDCEDCKEENDNGNGNGNGNGGPPTPGCGCGSGNIAASMIAISIMAAGAFLFVKRRK